MSWATNEVLTRKTSPIQEWKWRVIPLSQAILSKNGNKVPLPNEYKPLSSTKNHNDPTANLISHEFTGIYVSLCPHIEALCQSFLSQTEKMKNFVAQTIFFLKQKADATVAVYNILNSLKISLKEGKNLSRYSVLLVCEHSGQENSTVGNFVFGY